MLISCGLPIKASATLVGTSAGAGPKQSKPKEKQDGEIDCVSSKQLCGRFLGLLVAGVAGFGVLAYQPEIAAVSRPASRHLRQGPGRARPGLANYGDCTACTREPDGPPFFRQFSAPRHRSEPFTPPISRRIPRRAFGIWSRQAFRRSLKDGVGRKGDHLYPAFPYDHFTKVKDADIDADLRLLDGLGRNRCGKRREGTISGFPSTFAPCLRSGRFCTWTRHRLLLIRPRTRSGTRAAYLVEGLGHCGALP